MADLVISEKQVPVPENIVWGSLDTDSKDDGVTHEESADYHVFSDPVLAKYWLDVYE